MTIEEYMNEMRRLTEEYSQKKMEVNLKYGRSQIKFNLGDIIEDTRTNEIIQITNFGVYMTMNNIPRPKYNGIILTKKLQPTKAKKMLWIYAWEDHTNIKLIKSSNNLEIQ